MKRNKFGMSHKVKGDIDFGLIYPVLSQEMVPGDIIRVDPEALVKAVVPPNTQLTDKITVHIESAFTPDRLTDDHFVRNLSTTKTGQVKGDFKTWSTGEIEQNYGSVTSFGTTPLRSTNSNGLMSEVEPVYTRAKKSVNNCAPTNSTFVNSENISAFVNGNEYNEALPIACVNGSPNPTKKIVSAPYFGQGSLLDWLGLEPNGNLGQGVSSKFRVNHISAYYMFCNFYKTNPEYEKYIAPYFDYVYPGRDNSYNHETLHRYETLEDEFGNGFEEPRLSGRCVNGLVIDNWHSDYFTDTTKDPQRGIAPTVPVSITGKPSVRMYDSFGNKLLSVSSPSVGTSSTGTLNVTSSGTSYYAQVSQTDSLPTDDPLVGSFVISDLRTALALQHFQEDIQGTYKWSDFLNRVYGCAPTDSLYDQPKYCGGYKFTLVSNEVLCTAETSDGSVGEIGGHLSGYGKGKRMQFRSLEHGVFQVYLTVKVERNYESGTLRQFTRFNYLDMYFPQFVGIGNQAIRADELFAINGTNNGMSRSKNIAFSSRYEEMKHRLNRVVGKCRNNNMFVKTYHYNSSETRNLAFYTPETIYRSLSGTAYNIPYVNDFHPYAIGDCYSAGNIVSSTDSGLVFSEVNQAFLLCCPQMNDIFLTKDENPFLLVVGLNMDMFRPLPIYTKPGISYV